MKIKVSETTPIQLDWLVAKCEGHDVVVLTKKEQRDRWFEDVPPEKLAEETKDYDLYFASTVKPRICVVGAEGYKRAPFHSEASMLFNEGPARFQYSTSWAQGGPIIGEMLKSGVTTWDFRGVCFFELAEENILQNGSTPLIAAMRAFVASKLGEEVEIPDELT